MSCASTVGEIVILEGHSLIKAEWAPAGLMVARLSESHLALEVNRAEIADGRVPADRVVKSLNVVERIGPRLVSSPLGRLPSVRS